MPFYDYYCNKCETTIELEHSMNESDKERYCECGNTLKRVYHVPTIKGMSGGSIRTEKELLKMKQKQRSDRSKLHFKKEVLPTLDQGEKRFFEKKLKHIDASKKLK